jgi:hypothetical protein
MPDLDLTAPDAALISFLDSFTNDSYRARVGALGMLRLLEPTRIALKAYAETLVREARKSGATWEQIGDALHVPKQTAHRNYKHVDPHPE